MTPSTPSTMTRTITTRAICTSEHSSALLVVFPVLMLSHDPLGSSRSCVCHLIFTPCCTCAVLSDLFDLPFYFDLSFPVFFHSSVLMHPDLHTDLDNLDSVENNLRHSAKGSLDAYDVAFSLTDWNRCPCSVSWFLVALCPTRCSEDVSLRVFSTHQDAQEMTALILTCDRRTHQDGQDR